jgi:hypothetical protein
LARGVRRGAIIEHTYVSAPIKVMVELEARAKSGCFEALRSELGYADYLGAHERYRVEEMHDSKLLRMSNWLVDYPFAERLNHGELDAVRHAQRWGLSSSRRPATRCFSRARWSAPG